MYITWRPQSTPLLLINYLKQTFHLELNSSELCCICIFYCIIANVFAKRGKMDYFKKTPISKKGGVAKQLNVIVPRRPTKVWLPADWHARRKGPSYRLARGFHIRDFLHRNGCGSVSTFGCHDISGCRLIARDKRHYCSLRQVDRHNPVSGHSQTLHEHVHCIESRSRDRTVIGRWKRGVNPSLWLSACCGCMSQVDNGKFWIVG